MRYPAIMAVFLTGCGGGEVDVHERARSSLAPIEGEIALDGLEDEVEVLRDRHGIPHIYAKNEEDLFFALARKPRVPATF